MKYRACFDLSAALETGFPILQPGQWVIVNGARGRFLGVKPSGSIVVAWHSNACAWKRRPGGYNAYIRTLRTYATSTI